MQWDSYTFSEAITLANRFMYYAFIVDNPLAYSSAANASKWFIKAETARVEGIVRAEIYWRKNYL